MTADPLPGFARVRKARKSSTVACGHYVLVGQVIVCRPGGRWICKPCALADSRAKTSAATAAAEPTEGNRP